MTGDFGSISDRCPESEAFYPQVAKNTELLVLSPGAILDVNGVAYCNGYRRGND
jgi:hypothetical protein